MTNESIRLRLSPPQSEIFLDGDKYRVRVILSGRRFGKSKLIAPELLRAALAGKDQRVYEISPTWRMSRQEIWGEIKNISENYWEGKPPNETNMEINIVGGSKIYCRGANNPSALRGGYANFVAFDEFQDINPETWTSVMRPKLADRKGSAMMLGTPKLTGSTYFKELHELASDPVNVDYKAYQFTTLQGGWVTQDELERSKLDMSEKEWKAEYEASWELLDSGVYYAFNKDIHAARMIDYNPAFGLFWSLDFNVNPMCSVIGQVVPENITPGAWLGTSIPKTFIYILQEISLKDSNTPEACAEFIKRTKKYLEQTPGQIINLDIYGDAAGNHRQTSGAGAISDWETIRQILAMHPEFKVTYKYKSSNPPIRDKVNSVNAKFKNARGERTLFIDSRCKSLIMDLSSVTWIPGTTIIDSGPQRLLSHQSDSLAYAVETISGIRGNGGWKQDYLA